MKNFLRHTLWQEEFASGRMGRALDILLLFFLFFFFSVLLVNLTGFRDSNNNNNKGIYIALIHQR